MAHIAFLHKLTIKLKMTVYEYDEYAVHYVRNAFERKKKET